MFRWSQMEIKSSGWCIIPQSQYFRTMHINWPSICKWVIVVLKSLFSSAVPGQMFKKATNNNVNFELKQVRWPPAATKDPCVERLLTQTVHHRKRLWRINWTIWELKEMKRGWRVTDEALSIYKDRQYIYYGLVSHCQSTACFTCKHLGWDMCNIQGYLGNQSLGCPLEINCQQASEEKKLKCPSSNTFSFSLHSFWCVAWIKWFYICLDRNFDLGNWNRMFYLDSWRPEDKPCRPRGTFHFTLWHLDKVYICGYEWNTSTSLKWDWNLVQMLLNRSC